MNKLSSPNIDWISFDNDAFYTSKIIWEKDLLFFTFYGNRITSIFHAANIITKVCGYLEDDFAQWEEFHNLLLSILSFYV